MRFSQCGIHFAKFRLLFTVLERKQIISFYDYQKFVMTFVIVTKGAEDLIYFYWTQRRKPLLYEYILNY